MVQCDEGTRKEPWVTHVLGSERQSCLSLSLNWEKEAASGVSNFTWHSCPWRLLASLHLWALIFYTHVSHEPSLGVRYTCRHACIQTHVQYVCVDCTSDNRHFWGGKEEYWWGNIVATDHAKINLLVLFALNIRVCTCIDIAQLV
jgi:hypothetical protein